MATKGQIAFYMKLTGCTREEAEFLMDNVNSDGASRIIGHRQAQRGRQGALRIHPVKSSVRQYGRNERKRGSR